MDFRDLIDKIKDFFSDISQKTVKKAGPFAAKAKDALSRGFKAVSSFASGIFGSVRTAAGNIKGSLREGRLYDFYRKYRRYSFAAVAVLSVSVLIITAVILDARTRNGEISSDVPVDAVGSEIADIDVSQAVFIPAVVVDDQSEGMAQFDEDDEVYEGNLSDDEYNDAAGEVKRKILCKGDSNPVVAKIQERLMDLGYMDRDEPTEYYGPATHTAVERFQMKNELTVDGNVGEETLEKLFSDTAKQYSMCVGMSGEDVKELQSMLRNLGYLDSADGVFGPGTEAAVKSFQSKNGLTADGSAGHSTLEKLYSGNVVANYIGFGEQGDVILALQKKLRTLGYMTTEPDGKYGPDTVQAVKKFQENNGLMVDGYFGYDTKQLLNSGNATPNAFSIGDRGPQVENIQKVLVRLKYMNSATGYYGEATEAAVRAFQKRNSLSVDGKVGQNTLKKLLASDARPAASNAPKATAKATPTKKKSSSSTKKAGSSSKATSTPKPKKTSTPVKITGANASSLIEVAKSKLGCPYVRAGKGPDVFDCSGFVYWCLRKIGVNIGYMTSAGWRDCTRYETVSSLGSVKAGDIIVFKGHVGIALGGGQMIDASSSDGKIRIANLSGNYWKTNFIKACRLF